MRDTSGSLALNFNVPFKASIACLFQTVKYTCRVQAIAGQGLLLQHLHKMVRVDKILDVTGFKCIIVLYFHIKSASEFSSCHLQEEKYLLSSIKCNALYFII